MATANTGIINSAMTAQTGQSSNPAPDYNAQAAAIYQDKFGRAGDQAGINYWAGQLASGKSAADVNASFDTAAKDTYNKYASNTAAYDAANPGLSSYFKEDEGAKEALAANSQPVAKASSQSNNSASTYQPALLGTPGSWNVAPNQTVQGQLQALLDPNSPLIQQARTHALENANSRGLLNSSIAATGADEAAYAAAIPIATTDAATYNNAAGYNANEGNIFQQQNANSINSAGQFNAGAQNTLAGQRISSDTSLESARIAANTSTANTQSNNASQQAVAHINADAQAKFQGATSLSQLANNYQSQIANIGALNMDGASKQALQENIFAAYVQAVKALDAKLGIPDTSALLTFNPTGSTGTPASIAA